MCVYTYIYTYDTYLYVQPLSILLHTAELFAALAFLPLASKPGPGSGDARASGCSPDEASFYGPR